MDGAVNHGNEYGKTRRHGCIAMGDVTSPGADVAGD